MEAYHERLVKTISDIRGTSEKRSVEILRKCIHTIAIAKSIDPNKIKSMIFTEDFMESCIFSDCGEMELEECRKSCHCVEYHDGTCVSRYIKDARSINRDPDKYAKGLKTKELEELLELANYLYHNFEGGGLSDNAFDGLEFILNKRKKTRERRKLHIGALPVKKIRAALPVPMPSLNKVYSGTKKFKQFLVNSPGKIHWSVKLDGISALIVYKKGKVHRIFTRGDGTTGGDITYVKEYIKGVPKSLGDAEADMMVRGELVISREKFRSAYGELYSNSRNFVNSQIASGKITSFLPDVEFVAYELIKMNDRTDLPKPISRYEILALNRFKVVEHGVLSGNLMFDTLMLYKEKRVDSTYDIDGLVLQYDITLRVSDVLVNPTHAVAFKAILEEQIRDTRMRDVP